MNGSQNSSNILSWKPCDLRIIQPFVPSFYTTVPFNTLRSRSKFPHMHCLMSLTIFLQCSGNPEVEKETHQPQSLKYLLCHAARQGLSGERFSTVANQRQRMVAMCVSRLPHHSLPPTTVFVIFPKAYTLACAPAHTFSFLYPSLTTQMRGQEGWPFQRENLTSCNFTCLFVRRNCRVKKWQN